MGRQSSVVRYPEALLSPYWASSAKIALANNFQSDGDGGGGEGQGEEGCPDIDWPTYAFHTFAFTNELDVYQKQIILCTNEPFVDKLWLPLFCTLSLF